MIKIRLARVGKRKQPTYRFIVSESARDTYGKALEILGQYNPFSKVVEVNKERILYWISKGAQLSPTVNNMLIDQNVIEGKKVKASSGKKKKGEETPAPAAQKTADAKPEEKPAEAAPAEEKKPEAKAEDKPAETK